MEETNSGKSSRDLRYGEEIKSTGCKRTPCEDRPTCQGKRFCITSARAHRWVKYRGGRYPHQGFDYIQRPLNNLLLVLRIPIKILHVISGDIWAGAEFQFLELVLSLNRKNDLDVVCVILNKGLLRDNLEANNIKTILLEEANHNSLYLSLKLRALIYTVDPDIIHVHKVKEHFLGWLALLFIPKKIPIVRTVHGLGMVANTLQWLQRIRSSIVVSLDNFIMVWLADAVIAVSQDLAHLVKLNRISNKVYQINNGIDVDLPENGDDKAMVKQRYGADKTFWIGTAARLVDVKNLPMLIKSAFYLHQMKVPFRLSIFGDGPLRRELEQLIMSLELEGLVVLHGFEQNIYEVIMSLDVFVLCSLHEGLPISLLQAMCAMTPVVCTAVGGMKEVVNNGVNGILVQSNDSRSLADALMKLYNDRSLGLQLARNARRTVETNYSHSSMVQKVITLYGNLLGYAQ